MSRPNNQLFNQTGVRFENVTELTFRRQDTATSNKLVHGIVLQLTAFVKIVTCQVRVDARLYVAIKSLPDFIQLVAIVWIIPSPSLIDVKTMSSDP